MINQHIFNNDWQAVVVSLCLVNNAWNSYNSGNKNKCKQQQHVTCRTKTKRWNKRQALRENVFTRDLCNHKTITHTYTYVCVKMCTFVWIYVCICVSKCDNLFTNWQTAARLAAVNILVIFSCCFCTWVVVVVQICDILQIFLCLISWSRWYWRWRGYFEFFQETSMVP